MNSITVKAYAKVNLFLKVLNRRKDSYHNILTLFERISLADTITISKARNGVALTCDRPVTRRPYQNLAYRAAKLILEYNKVRGGVRIHIVKRIPVGAGLGGGSSDAAAVLRGIDMLYDLKMKKISLRRLGAKLGADVGFFLLDAPFALGRGDRLIPFNYKIKVYHLLIYPGFGLSTRKVYEAYAALSKGLTLGRANAKIRPKLADTMDFGAAESMLDNDLQKTAVSKQGVTGRIIERLASSLGKRAIVSGSGPSVFCLYRTGKEALEAKRKLAKEMPAGENSGWQVFVSGTR